jgi:hypothetical protein
VNRDGTINQADFSFVSARLGKSYPGRGFFTPGFVTGDDPRSVDIGDLNGDGSLDLVVANRGSDNISVLLGNGGGGFHLLHRYPVGNAPEWVALEDLNGDNNLDLVVAVTAGRQISVRLGLGDGNFGARRHYVVGDEPRQVVIGDLNNDGDPDLAVFNRSSDYISILLGSGDGSFARQQHVIVGDGTTSMALGDVNGDGAQDLVISKPGVNSNGWVTVLLGNGDGSFQVESNIELTSYGGGAVSLALGDMNSDGVLDLAVARAWNVVIFIGEGDGGFHSPHSYYVNDGPLFLQLEDINRDGSLDLLAAGRHGVAILLGHGDGSLEEQQFINNSMPIDHDSMAVGDIDGDGHIDIAQVTGNLFYGSGHGSFEVPEIHDVERSDDVELYEAHGDINRDGNMDIAISFEFYGYIILYLGNGDGSFQVGESISISSTVSIESSDLNGDGNLDLVIGNEDYMYKEAFVIIVLGNGDGSFQAQQRIAEGGCRYIVELGDLNGDGVPDLVFADACDGDVSVMLGNGDGSFQLQQLVFSTNYFHWFASIDLGDLNGDGVPDLVIGNNEEEVPDTSGSVSVLIGNGDGSFQPGQRLEFSGGVFTVSALRDINRDSNLDILLSNGYLFPGNGNGSFEPGQPFSSGGASVIGDVNGDNVDDVVSSGQGVSVMLGNGDGSYQEEFHIGTHCSEIDLADFYGNGRLDILCLEHMSEDNNYLSALKIIRNRINER